MYTPITLNFDKIESLNDFVLNNVQKDCPITIVKNIDGKITFSNFIFVPGLKQEKIFMGDADKFISEISNQKKD